MSSAPIGGMRRVLVVYYSRTGHTEQIAEQVSQAIDGDVEPLEEASGRSGAWGYLRSAYEALVHRVVPLGALKYDPHPYDLVIVGTPVWNMSVSSPVRSYLQAYRDRLNAVAFFATCGGQGADRAFGQMARVCGRDPIATLVVREAELDRAAPRVVGFVRELDAALAQRAPVIVPAPPQPPAPPVA